MDPATTPAPERSQTIIGCMREVADAPPETRLQVFREHEAHLRRLAHASLLPEADVDAAVREMAVTHGLDRSPAADVSEPQTTAPAPSPPLLSAVARSAKADAGESWRGGAASSAVALAKADCSVPVASPSPPSPARGGGSQSQCVGRSEAHVETSWRAHVADAESLRSRQFAAIQYVAPGLIPEGVTLLASRPKLGKSWLVLDLCIACAAGRVTLGTIRPVQGDVLYLALEDNARRLQRRIARLLPGPDATWPERLTFATHWRRTDDGGLADIAEWSRSVPAPRLAVVDTLEKIRPFAAGLFGGGADQRAIAGLHGIASELGLAIVVVHHDRKAESDDPFDTVRGPLGLVGAADTVLVLKRRPAGTVLYARGRDVEESETAVRFDKGSCKWTILGPAAQVHRSDERARVVAALGQAGAPLPIRDIQARADLPSRGAADTLLFRMVEAGEIERVGKGVYGLAAE